MSASPSRNSSKSSRKKKSASNLKQKTKSALISNGVDAEHMAFASALDRGAVDGVVGRTPRSAGAPADWEARLGRRGGAEDKREDGGDDVRMSLLDEDQRRAAVSGADDSVEELGGARPERPLSPKDKRAMALLVLLCA
jgi:hypothetical protein